LCRKWEKRQEDYEYKVQFLEDAQRRNNILIFGVEERERVKCLWTRRR
jgi:hypothetical protein